MKKLLLILLCVPLMFSCGEKEEKKTDEGSLNKEITKEMLKDGYTGQGTYTVNNGDNYVGEYKDGKKHGQGTLTCAGTKYVGEWKDGKKHGQGTYTNYYGDKYVGEWKDGKEHGTMIYDNGAKYVGGWLVGLPNGQGTFTYADGTVKEGLWKDGEFIGEE